jgi:HK97 family phage prohead protease
MSVQLERRFLEASEGVELRVEPGEGEKPRIAGYFAVYNRFSPVYGNFRERIAPGFFDEAIQRDDIRALYNHDPNMVLGRNKAGTLRLLSDGTGLHGEIDLPDTQQARDLAENIRLRNISGASFSFAMEAKGGDVWEKAADGVWERTLLKAATMFDVGPVTYPFYPDTAVGMRSTLGLDAADESLARWVEAERSGSDWIQVARMRLDLLKVS